MIDIASHWILSILIFFPILVAVLILFIPKQNDFKNLKIMAVTATIVEFALSLHLVKHFISSSGDFQFSNVVELFPSNFGIQYRVGVDGLSLILVMLTTFFSIIVMFTIITTIKEKLIGFLAFFFILQSAIIGVFVSLDIVFFYIFWELSIIPAYFMIGIWGGKKRIYATTKLFIYGVIGSFLMLVGLIYLYFLHGSLNHGIYSANIIDLYKTAALLPFSKQAWIFLSIMLAFGIKAPIFPLHTWLADVYEQAPTVYTLMSGILLKLATYGIIRFGICLFPAAATYFAEFFIILAVIGIIYGALIAWKQTNLRRIMAFSSLSHLGFIIIGIFSLNTIGIQGALYQMVNHAVTAGALFILINFLYEKRHSFELNDFGGLTSILPWFSFFFVTVVMGAVALPSTGSFIGEWLILIGTFQAAPVLTTIATLGVVFGAIYMLWAAYKVLFGPITNEENKSLKGLSPTEVFQLTTLTLCIFVLGFASAPILEHSKITLVKIEKSIHTLTPYNSEFVHLENGELVPLKFIGHSIEGGSR